MASIFTHPVPTLALAFGVGSGVISGRLLVAGVICSLLPDVDVLGFRLGIAYGNVLGHRGLSHSLLLGFCLGCLGAVFAPLLKSGRLTAFLVMWASFAGHIVLDAMTNGGLGVAAFWPWDKTRYFLPWRPIIAAPLSPKTFFSAQGIKVMMSELVWVWLPCAFAALGLRTARFCKAINR